MQPIQMTPDYTVLRTGPVCVIIWRGAVVREGIRRLTETAMSALRDYPEQVYVLGIVEEGAAVPDSEAREWSVEANDELAAAGVQAFAGVHGAGGFFGAWVRGVITTLNLLSRKSYPFKVFATPTAACEWFAASCQPALDLKQCAADIERFRCEYLKSRSLEEAPPKGEDSVRLSERPPLKISSEP